MRASLIPVRGLFTLTCLAAVVFSGCAARIASNTSTGPGAASARIVTASPVATSTVVGVLAAGAIQYYTLGPEGREPMAGAPEPDPARTINLRDCTQPIDPEAGNLMCR